MRLDYLRYFDHLAEVLNYTHAAEDLYIAQPTLSVAIKRMEQELGFKLFRRGEGNEKTELTQAGAVFREHVSLALKTYDAGVRGALEVQGELNSRLRIGTIYAMQGQLWSKALQAFSTTQAAPPEFFIEQAYSATLIERLRRKDLDVVFAAQVGDVSDLRKVLVWSQPLVLCVHKTCQLARREEVLLEELDDREVLTYALESPVNDAIETQLPIDALNLRRSYDDEITLCAMVQSDPRKAALLCYSFLVEAFPDVVCLRVKDLPMDFHKVYLISRCETHPRVVDDFISFMSAYRFPNAIA